ncbi:MAG: DUF2339 domain-containing protein, partial [Bacillota bacterium]
HAILFAAIALVFTLLARSRAWPQARWPGYALLPVLWIVALFAFIERPHALGDLGWIAWPFAIGVMAFVLRDVDDRDASNGWHETMHAATFLLVAALGAWEMHWAAVRTTADGTAWSVASVLLVPAMLLLVAVSRKVDERWPIVRHKLAYRAGAVGVVLAAMGVWIIYANATHDGTSDPLPYLPLVNAIDLGHILIAICGVGAWLAWRRSGIPVRETKELLGTAGALTFIWLNGMLLRSLHHWADVPYRLGPMMRSVIVQASISVFWTVIALALMVYATRSARRVLWMTGAVLMGVVVVKLFLVDLEHLSGIERIVAFIVVGLLMLVIGYFSPVPPRRVDERQAEEQHA